MNQFRHSRDTSRHDTPTAEGKEQRWENYVRRPSVTKRDNPPADSILRSPPLEEENLSSSEESDSEEDSTRRRPRFGRFGKFSTQRAGLRDDEDDEDGTPAFLPMARDAETAPRDRPGEELGATLRLDAERVAAAQRRMAGRSESRRTESSTSSISSGVPVSQTQGDSGRIGPLSPHRAGTLPRQSPRKSIASGRENSDGTPSMGSSFSDLDGESPLLRLTLLILITHKCFRRQCYAIRIGGSFDEQHAEWRHGKPNEHDQPGPAQSLPAMMDLFGPSLVRRYVLTARSSA